MMNKFRRVTGNICKLAAKLKSLVNRNGIFEYDTSIAQPDTPNLQKIN